jgi:IS1 family transposase
MHVLPFDQQVRVTGALTEGCSIRSVERLTDTHRDTIMRLGVRIGVRCQRLHDMMMRNLQVATIELDEQWAFIGKKQKHVTDSDSPELGDCYLFTAIAATQKAVLSYAVGKRNAETTEQFMNDLRSRIVNRPQITADGFAPYVPAIDLAFADQVDFGQLVKIYQTTPGNEAAVRYSPGTVTSIVKTPVFGNPDPDLISTSFVERFNLNTRMAVRRFTRLTNAFSKKLANHKAAIALYVAHYNLCHVHETIRCTPAMALGVTDHIWSVAELIEQAVAIPLPPPPSPSRDPETGLLPGRKPFQLRVIRGGKLH